MHSYIDSTKALVHANVLSKISTVATLIDLWTNRKYEQTQEETTKQERTGNKSINKQIEKHINKNNYECIMNSSKPINWINT